MAAAARLDLSVHWTEDFMDATGWGLSDPATGLPFDLTNYSIQMQVRRAAGAPNAALIDAEFTTDATITGVTIPNPTTGFFFPQILAADLKAISGDQNIHRLAYDVRLGYPGIKHLVLLEGSFTILPGVSQ